MHHEVRSLSEYLHSFIHPKWCWISSINRSDNCKCLSQRSYNGFLSVSFGPPHAQQEVIDGTQCAAAKVEILRKPVSKQTMREDEFDHFLVSMNNIRMKLRMSHFNVFRDHVSSTTFGDCAQMPLV